MSIEFSGRITALSIELVLRRLFGHNCRLLVGLTTGTLKSVARTSYHLISLLEQSLHVIPTHHLLEIVIKVIVDHRARLLLLILNIVGRALFLRLHLITECVVSRRAPLKLLIASLSTLGNKLFDCLLTIE